MTGPLSAGNVIGGRYKIEKYLAEGGMQFVYVANDLVAGRRVALKTPKNASAQKRFSRSAIVSAKVNHPNVAKTLDYVEDGGLTFLIEELVEGQDLRDALLSESDFVDPYLAARVFHFLAKGVAAAHHAGVVHRDLKPTNVMIVGGYDLAEVKITDFGVAKMAQAEIEEAVEGGEESLSASKTAVGAIPYMAPEAIENQNVVGLPSDIWALGAMVFHILCGEYPFGSGLKAIPRIIAGSPPVVPLFVLQKAQFQPLASEILEIVFTCLQKDPALRPTADQLVERTQSLCYTVSRRYVGIVEEFNYGAHGKIRFKHGRAFYHKDSVYGAHPAVGDRVLFSCYNGGQLPRALPVVKLKK